MTRAFPTGSAPRTSALRLLVAAVMSITMGVMWTIGSNVVSAPPAGAQEGPEPENVSLAFVSEVDDVTTDELTVTVLAALGDPRGWGRAGYTFTADEASGNRVVLVETDAAAGLCGANDLDGALGCQGGPAVVLNAASWRDPAEGWADADEFRRYQINHLVGHLIGQFHPENRCPVAGEPEVVMAPQFAGLEECQPNAWPLGFDVLLASARPVELAPAIGAQPETRPANPGGQTVPTLPPADEPTDAPTQEGDNEADGQADDNETTAALDNTAQTGAPDDADGSGSPTVLIIVGVIVILALLAGAVVFFRRRQGDGAAPVSDEASQVGESEAAGETEATDLEGEGVDALVTGTTDNVGVEVVEVDDGLDATAFLPLGSDDVALEPNEAPNAAAWTFRTSGAAQQNGQLSWLVPPRWGQHEVEQLTGALNQLVAPVVGRELDEAPETAQVGEVLAEFLRQHPHLAPADHEGVGLALWSGDLVVAVALGATEVIELRNGLAKPARRQGVLRLRHDHESPLEVEVSVAQPARPRARIVVERTDAP